MIATLRQRLWGKSQATKTAVTLDATQAARLVAKYERASARGDKPKPIDEDFLSCVLDASGWTRGQWDAQVAHQTKLLALAETGHPEKVEATRQRAAELAEAYDRGMKSEETRHKNAMAKLAEQYEELGLANHEHNRAVAANQEVYSKMLATSRERELNQQLSSALSPRINDLRENLRFATNGLNSAKAQLAEMKDERKNTPLDTIQKQQAHVTRCQETVDASTARLLALRKEQAAINDELRAIRKAEVEAVFAK